MSKGAERHLRTSPRLLSGVREADRQKEFKPAPVPKREAVYQIIERKPIPPLDDAAKNIIAAHGFKEQFQGRVITFEEFDQMGPHQRGAALQEVEMSNYPLVEQLILALGFEWILVDADGEVLEGSPHAYERPSDTDIYKRAKESDQVCFAFTLEDELFEG